MSDAIKGSKSSLYIKEEVPGVSGSADTIDHVSVQNFWGGKGALDVAIHAYYVSNLVPLSIEAGSVRRKIKITNHGAIAGDALRMSSGGANSEEVSILKIVDADWFVIAKEINASVGDNCDILKPVSPTYNKDGSLNVSSGPVSYNDIQAGTVVEATADSITPANNKAVPNGMYIKKDDGNWYPVTLDQTNPFQHTPIPVAITDVLGNSNVNVDLAGSTLNVSIKHDSLDPSSVRIGDGVNVLEINGANEATVHDADVLGELITLNAVDFSTEAKQDSIIIQLTTLNSVDFSTEAKQDATNTKIDTLIAKDFATQTTLAALLSELQLKADLSETQPVSIQNTSIAVTGPLTDTELRAAAVATQEVSADGVTPFNSQAINRTAQKTVSTIGTDYLAKSVASITLGFDGDEHREISLDSTGKVNIASSQLPSTLGIKTAALSLSVAPASDAVFTTTETPSGTSTDASQDGDHTTGATFTKPANAKKMVIFNNADATVANRIRFGSAPNWTTRQGAILGVGASTALLPAATFVALAEDSSSQANVSVIYFY